MCYMNETYAPIMLTRGKLKQQINIAIIYYHLDSSRFFPPYPTHTQYSIRYKICFFPSLFYCFSISTLSPGLLPGFLLFSSSYLLLMYTPL